MKDQATERYSSGAQGAMRVHLREASVCRALQPVAFGVKPDRGRWVNSGEMCLEKGGPARARFSF